MQARVRVLALWLTLVAVVSLTLGGCVAAGPSAPDPRLEGTWHLASGTLHGTGLPIGGRSVTLTIGDADHTGGSSPCSSYKATVTGGVGVVFIRASFSNRTRDSCTSSTLTTLEQLYISALTASRFASLDEGALVLTSPDSMLVFVRTAPASVASVVLTRWQLYSIPGQDALVSTGHGTHPISLSFDGSKGFTVHSNCEAISGSYEITGEHFDLSHFAVQTLGGVGCSAIDRSYANRIDTALYGTLLLDVSRSSGAMPGSSAATLVITNTDDDLPLVWRAER